MASSSRTNPNVIWDAERHAVVLFGGNIKGTITVGFDFGDALSDSLKSRVCFFVLDIFRKRGLAGLKKFYGSDRLRQFPDETPPDAPAARRFFPRPQAWTQTNLDAMVREWLVDHEEFARPASREFATQLAAATSFIEETGVGQMAAFPDLNQGRIVVRPAVMVDDFVIALADPTRKAGFRVCEASEVNAVAWTTEPEQVEEAVQAAPKRDEARAH